MINQLGKQFASCDDEGNETELTACDRIGESWELADMGFEDSVVSDGWLAGNTISEMMETYLERIVGEDVYNYYGRQFPLLIKFLDIHGKLSVQVHPDDEIAAERYDSLGKAEAWYIVDVEPGAKIYLGFNRDVTAQELYDRCSDGTVEEILNVVYPKKGDVILMAPGTVHSAEGGILVAEIQESSDLNFRLYDWGREASPATARQMHLEEAIDMVNYSKFDSSLYRKGPLWEDAASGPCTLEKCSCTDECHCGEECTCTDECHCHEHHSGGHHCHHHHHEEDAKVAEILVDIPQFKLTKLDLKDSLHIYTEQFGRFIVYMCVEGAASVQVASSDGKGKGHMDSYELKKGDTILIPADMSDFYLVPRDIDTILLEVVTEPVDEVDCYIDPETDAFLEGEDYEEPSGASPLNFFS